MINAQMIAVPHREQQALDEIVDEHERARLCAGALNGKVDRIDVRIRQALHANDELGDHVLPSHVGPVDVVRADDDDALQVPPPVVDGHQLVDDLAARV